MGESMSKRLKLQLGGEAEMEERAFANPYPDYQPHGAAAAPSAADSQRDRALLPAEDESLPFGADGKVSPGRARRQACLFPPMNASEVGAAIITVVLPHLVRVARVFHQRKHIGKGGETSCPLGDSRTQAVGDAGPFS
uniref:Uncharacterized protein n=1 Tax=Strigops habroptila TaxID=2489341 RepID=A0A672THA0_STRHB